MEVRKFAISRLSSKELESLSQRTNKALDFAKSRDLRLNPSTVVPAEINKINNLATLKRKINNAFNDIAPITRRSSCPKPPKVDKKA
jgi:hypothetical protein